jgi:hypothetical protein
MARTPRTTCIDGPLLDWTVVLHDCGQHGSSQAPETRWCLCPVTPTPCIAVGNSSELSLHATLAPLQGNAGDYANPLNSMLPAVLARRLGLPIALAVIHCAVGRAAGIPLSMVNFPGHVGSAVWRGFAACWQFRRG